MKEIEKIIVNTKISEFIENVLSPVFPYMPTECLLINLMVFFSKNLCFHRVTFDDVKFTKKVYPNIYAILFNSSGEGKDSVVNFLNDFFIDGSKADLIGNYRELKNNEFESKKKSAQKLSLSLYDDISSGTKEGISNAFVDWAEAGFGSVHFSNSEFVNFLSIKNENVTSLLSMLMDIFDHGQIKNHITISKNTKILDKKTNGVPCTLLVHSAIEKLLDDTDKNNYLKGFLENGFARRTLVCYPDIATFEEINLTLEDEENLKDIKEKRELAHEVLSIYQKFFNNFLAKYRLEKKQVTIGVTNISEYENKQIYEEGVGNFSGDKKYYLKNKNLKLSSEIKDYYFDLENKARREINNNKNRYYNNCLILEKKNQNWKIFKLSAIIACIENMDTPNYLTITLDNFKLAEKIVDFFSKQLYNFYKKRSLDDVVKVFNFIRENQEFKKISRMDIRQLDFAPPKHLLTLWIKAVINDVEEFCDITGKWKLIKTQGSGLAEFYFIKEIPRHKNINDINNISINLSIKNVDKNNLDTTPNNYKNEKIKFVDLPKIITEFNYSASAFLDNYRKGENWLSNNNCIIIDFDNDSEEKISSSEIRNIFKDFLFLIAPTKSNNKEKGGIIAERFRFILPLSVELPSSKNLYKQAIDNIINYYQIDKYVDKACIYDVARFYFPSPDEGIINYGARFVINWRVFSPIQVPNVAQAPSVAQAPNEQLAGKIKKNIYNNPLFWKQYKNKKTIVLCPLHENDGKKHNPSAFIDKSEQTGNLYFHCSKCSKEKNTMWDN
jgi:hypothetical protein